MVTAQPRTLTCRDARGQALTVTVTGHDPLDLPGSALPARLLRTGSHGPLVEKRVPPGQAGGYALLDAEIRAAVRLAAAYPGDLPPELPRLVGYDVDGDEPFVLLAPYRGEPVRALGPGELRAFTVGTLRALALVAAAGVVHDAVSVERLRWDGRAVSLTDFEHALVVGERRRARTGVAGRRDDLYAAGVALAALGPGGPPGPGRLDPTAWGPTLGAVLPRMLVDDPAQRADHVSLLAELAADPPAAVAADLDAGLVAGRRRFAADRARATAAPPSPPPVVTRRRPQPALVLIVTLAVVVALVVLAARLGAGL